MHQSEKTANMAQPEKPKQHMTRRFTVRSETIDELMQSTEECIVGSKHMGFRCTEVRIESLPKSFWQWLFRRGQHWMVECKYETDPPKKEGLDKPCLRIG